MGPIFRTRISVTDCIQIDKLEDKAVDILSINRMDISRVMISCCFSFNVIANPLPSIPFSSKDIVTFDDFSLFQKF